MAGDDGRTTNQIINPPSSIRDNFRDLVLFVVDRIADVTQSATQEIHSLRTRLVSK